MRQAGCSFAKAIPVMTKFRAVDFAFYQQQLLAGGERSQRRMLPMHLQSFLI